ncbi:MAG: primosomal protein N' [Gammaproteobacteria bacterium]|nr:primosomal protein N' [Gammaproteobacteria bacterium]
MTPRPVARVAVPVPLRKTFDFLVPGGVAVQPGIRVRVPFGSRDLVGVVTRTDAHSEVPASRLKPLRLVLDAQPIFAPKLLSMLLWAADYYHHPVGEVIAAALPDALRRGGHAEPKQASSYALTDQGRALDIATLGRAEIQRRFISMLRENPGRLINADQCRAVSPSWRRAVAALIEKGLVSVQDTPVSLSEQIVQRSAIRMNAAQSDALTNVIEAMGRYQSFLLHGVTSSGKTEVYLRVVQTAIERGTQALVLVPEIALTPQLIARFRQRVASPVVVLHSGLSSTERHQAWWLAHSGMASVVLGTRSAVFTPLKRPGVCIIDEEHDTSYKQQDGFRYNARDLALYRAKLEGTPIVLGSATPSLETLANADQGRHCRLELAARAGSATVPKIHLVDLTRVAATHGLSGPLMEAIRRRVAQGEQSLIFLNRRGYAPVLYCPKCHWHAHCPRCDAKLTHHKRTHRLRCHHCGHEKAAPTVCPDCGHTELINVGEGTQRIEEALRVCFPEATILRIDRDALRRRGHLEATLKRVHEGDADILVGTQLLSKGHDFPNVTLVGVVNADQGLYSIDFRAAEHLFQQIIQVAGRAGRADRPGEVLVQTCYPGHPYFQSLLTHDYEGFARQALSERKQAEHPPYQHFALLRAESASDREAVQFLFVAREQATRITKQTNCQGVRVMDPVPAPMEKRGGRYRAQLLTSAAHRRPLHEMLGLWLQWLEQAPQGRRVRWSLDVDPADLY